jgi:hypothetical protein
LDGSNVKYASDGCTFIDRIEGTEPITTAKNNNNDHTTIR